MKTALLLACAIATGPALAAPRTVTLSIPTMNCPSCPLTIKAALTRLPGVGSVTSDLGKRQTTVVYDDGQTGLAALSKATADAGFPATPVRASK